MCGLMAPHHTQIGLKMFRISTLSITLHTSQIRANFWFTATHNTIASNQTSLRIPIHTLLTCFWFNDAFTHYANMLCNYCTQTKPQICHSSDLKRTNGYIIIKLVYSTTNIYLSVMIWSFCWCLWRFSVIQVMVSVGRFVVGDWTW